MSREFFTGRVRSIAVALALAASVAMLAPAGAQAGTPSLPVLGSLGATTTLAGSLDDVTATAQWTGAVGAGAPATAMVSLQHRDQAQLLALIAAVSNPKSSQYRHYLTATQFDARFAPTAKTVAAVESYLTTFGLKVASVPVNRAYVLVDGTAGEMARAFDTTIDSYMRAGVRYQAPRQTLSIPAALKGVITGVTGLDTGDIDTPDIATGTNPFSGLGLGTSAGTAATTNAATPSDTSAGSCITSDPAAPTTTTQADATKTPPDAAYVNAAPFSTAFDSCAASQAPGYGGQATLGDVVEGYTPQQIEGAYGVSDAIAAGLNGSGETVAVIDAYSSPTMTADADRWSANMGLPTPNLTIDDTVAEESQPDGPTIPTDVPIVGGVDLQDPSGWFGEESLDVEAVHAMAPDAAIIVQSATSAENVALEQAQNKVVEADVAQEVSNSYGGSGAGGDATNNTSDGYWEQAAAEGMGVEMSSGDDGDNTEGGGDDAEAGVDDGPNSPYVTAVGGTTLAIGPADDYEWETYWSDQTATLANGSWGALSYDGGGGGGVSEVYPEPYWQKGVVPASIADYWQGNANAESSSDTIPGRAVPDVAMLADPNTGFLMGDTQDFSAYADPLETPNALTDEDAYDQYRIGGTSLSSPLFAGMMALADQAAGTQLGFADPALYSLDTADPSAFHDPDTSSPVAGIVRTNFTDNTDASGGTTTVLRTFDDLGGVVQALSGYDDSTGLGSPDGLAFLCGLAPRSALLESISGSPCAKAAGTTPGGGSSSSGGNGSGGSGGSTVTTAGATTTVTTPSTTAAPSATATAAGSVANPKAKACTASESLSYVQHPVYPVRETRAVLYLNDHRTRTVTGKRIVDIVMARPKASAFTVKLVAYLNDGEVIAHTYRYSACRLVKVTATVLHKRDRRA